MLAKHDRRVKGPTNASRSTRLIGSLLAAWLGACTEPNPYLATAETGSDSGSTTMQPSSSSSGVESSATLDTSTTLGEPSCVAQGLTCVPVAPAGFSGPFAWLERPADAPLACPAPFERELVEAFSELSAPAASCECECGPIGSAGCGDAAVTRLATTCVSAVQETQDLVPGCNQVGGAGWPSSSSFHFDAPAKEGGCIPQPTVGLDPAAFLTRHLGCAGAFSTAGCEPDELCAPPPGDPLQARWCVWQDGDAQCPAGDYAERTLLYRGFQDQRGCQQCTCTLPEGPCDGTSMVLYSSTNCSTGPHVVAPDTCLGGFGGPNITGILHVGGTPPTACESGTVVPIGDAAGIDPVTFCCTP